MKLKATVAAGALAAATMVAAPAPAHAQSDPLLGQMMAFGGNFCPRGWATTDGQLLAISSNTALFSLLGTMYGGDGRTTFGLPDLRGRAPISVGTGPGIGSYTQGAKGGATSFTMTIAQMPAHNHTGTVGASPTNADAVNPVRNGFAVSVSGQMYRTGAPANNNMHPDTLRIRNTGGGQAVNKLSPYQVVRWCIATIGTFPSRS